MLQITFLGNFVFLKWRFIIVQSFRGSMGIFLKIRGIRSEYTPIGGSNLFSIPLFAQFLRFLQFLFLRILQLRCRDCPQ